MENREYNGWFNYETWLCNLWMDEDTCYWSEQAEIVKIQHRENEQAITLADMIKTQIEEGADAVTGESGLYGDMLEAALGEINYYEIAESLLENVVDEEEEENKEE